MHKEIERAILKTLIYSDIFNYPLSQDELWKFLINKKLDKKSFLKLLKNLNLKYVNIRNNFYCLLGRENIINTRIGRNKESRKKIVMAKKIIKQLSRIPTIQLIGISGALSLENSGGDDDIDLFVIASKGSIWLTRLAMINLLVLLGRYRRRNEREVSDKICLNMIIDETALVFPKERQNLYTAHEIVQLMPVFERNDMYKKFMGENKWVEKFLPNSIDTKILGYKDIKRKERKSLSILISQYLNILNPLAKKLQLWFIKKHVTTETVRDNFLAFHPLDYKNKTLSEYRKRLRMYEI